LQPPFPPGALLKLYLYGYLNRVHSSRRLLNILGLDKFRDYCARRFENGATASDIREKEPFFGHFLASYRKNWIFSKSCPGFLTADTGGILSQSRSFTAETRSEAATEKNQSKGKTGAAPATSEIES
jgi:hypothetical protein